VATVLVVVADEVADEAASVGLAQDNDVIQELPAKGADPSFRYPVGLSCQMHPMGTLRYDVSG